MFTPIAASFVPASARFDTDRYTAGQMIEVAYAAAYTGRSEAIARDAKFKRVTDRSDGTVSYFSR